MTDSNYTMLVIVADRSGSMASMRQEAQDMINSLFADQADNEGVCDVMIYGFNETVHVDMGLCLVDRAPSYELEPSGGTALHDAMGRAIAETGERLASRKDYHRPGKVIVAVVTDGHENSSQHYDAESIRQAVTLQRDEYGWDFVFLGANQDAVLTAGRFGIAPSSAMTYDTAKVGAAGQSLSSYVTRSRTAGGQSASFTDAERQAAVGSQ